MDWFVRGRTTSTEPNTNAFGYSDPAPQPAWSRGTARWRGGARWVARHRRPDRPLPAREQAMERLVVITVWPAHLVVTDWRFVEVGGVPVTG